jgi:hypothetical protein
MADLHLIGKSLSVQMGNVLLPVVLQLAQALGRRGAAHGAVLRQATAVRRAAAALEGYAALNALIQLVKFLNVLLMTPVGKGWVDSVSAAWHWGDVTAANEKVQNAIAKRSAPSAARTAEEAPRRQARRSAATT